MTNNIIEFPKDRVVRINDLAEIETKAKLGIDDVKLSHIEEALSLMIPMLFQQLEIAGFEFIDDEEDFYLRDSAFVVEALRSLMLKYYDLDHPFQKVVENIFEAEENGLLSIVDRIELDLSIETGEDVKSET